MPFFARFFISFFLFSLFFSFPFASQTIPQVYKWTDENGNFHFTDAPPPGVKAQKIVEDPSESAPPARISPLPIARASGKRDYSDIKVTIYTTSWCPYCKRAKEYLNSLDVNYTEYDIEKDKVKAAEFRSKGGSGVPLVDIDGIIIKGYSPASIKSALDSKRNR